MNNNLVNEISISGGNILQTLRQPERTGESGDLVFVYPILIDGVLEKNYGNLIRDFVTTSFLARIKTSNVLSIIVDATSPGQIERGGESLNPAQELHRFLGGSPPPPQQQSGSYQGQIDAQKRFDYSETLSKLREYVKLQIKTDPSYIDLRPIISEVVAQNLIPIPIIIGTKIQKVGSIPMYWILFIAAGQKISLDVNSNLNGIKNLLRQMPSSGYEKFMTELVPSVDLNSPTKLNQAISQMQDGVDKAMRGFNLCLNEAEFNAEVGVNNKSAQVSTAINNVSTSQTALSARASSAFKSFISNEVVGLLQSIVHAIIPEAELDISSKFITFVNSVGNSSPTYTTMQDFVMGKATSTTDLDSLMKTSLEICKQNSEINVNKLFSNLSTLKFTVTGGSGGRRFFSNNAGDNLAEFSADIVGYSSSLAALNNSLEEYLSILGGNRMVEAGTDFKAKILDDIKIFFRGGFETNQGITTALDNRITTANNISTSAFFTSRRFKFLTGQIDANGNPTHVAYPADQREFEKNMFGSLTEIIYFLFLFSFLSFFCEYLKEIEASVTVQRRDATSFPNYVLVTKLDYITRIFWALATSNFANSLIEGGSEENENLKPPSRAEQVILDRSITDLTNQLRHSVRPMSPVERDQITQKISDLQGEKSGRKRKVGVDTEQFRISSGMDITRQINLIKERLRIPNIIVIDEKTKKIYYRFMYMQRVQNLTTETIQSYINQQKDILSVF